MILALIAELKSFPALQKLTIENPAAFQGLPNFKKLQYVNLQGIPHRCENWAWLAATERLEELYVSLRTTTNEPSSEYGHEERLEMSDKNAVFIGMTNLGISTILRNLHANVLLKVSNSFSLLTLANHIFCFSFYTERGQI